ncbi:MAG: asparagine synthase [Thioploca sp.]|nr:asparagine synthase [Thioploca sp.]
MNFWLDKLRSKKNNLMKVIELVNTRNLSYLGETALYDLAEVVLQVEKEDVEGIFVETGCALGGSAIVITAAKSKNRELYIYDVFGIIPGPSDKDGPDVQVRYNTILEGKSEGLGGDSYYGYLPNLYDKVAENFDLFNLAIEKNRVHLIKGLYEETLHINTPVAFAHIDCDWYDSVMTCLKRIEPHLARKGVLVIDDYYYWPGCKAAVDEYFSDKQKNFVFVNKSRLHIEKSRNGYLVAERCQPQ